MQCVTYASHTEHSIQFARRMKLILFLFMCHTPVGIIAVRHITVPQTVMVVSRIHIMIVLLLYILYYCVTIRDYGYGPRRIVLVGHNSRANKTLYTSHTTDNNTNTDTNTNKTLIYDY